MFPGFPTRLYNELNSIFLNKVLKGDADAYKKSKIKFKIIVIIQSMNIRILQEENIMFLLVLHFWQT